MLGSAMSSLQEHQTQNDVAEQGMHCPQLSEVVPLGQVR